MTPTRKQRRIVVPMAEVIYLADRIAKTAYPQAMAAFTRSVIDGGTVIPVAFGAVTRSERMRERRAGWSSKAIAAVRISEERRGNRR